MNKITRSQFLRLLPAAGLLLTACAEQAGPTAEVQLVPAGTAALDYAQQFTATKYEGGYTLLSIPADGAQFLVVPEGAAVPTDVPDEDEAPDEADTEPI